MHNLSVIHVRTAHHIRTYHETMFECGSDYFPLWADRIEYKGWGHFGPIVTAEAINQGLERVEK